MRLTAAFMILAAALAAACSSSQPEPKAASDADRILVTHSADSISVENKSGNRLLGVRIELSVTESPQPYILTVAEIEQGAKAEVQLNTFKSDAADVLVDPASVHPTQIAVRARDTFGKPHEVTVPWQ